MTGFALIGDIHSQVGSLEKSINYCKSKDLTPIFLGDLFDSRVDQSDSAGVYRLVREAEVGMGAITLRSNHQYKLERYARGNKVFISSDLARTLEDFSEADLSIEEVSEWLNTFPYGLVFKDSEGKEYRCAHAMFPRWLAIPSYSDMYKVMQVTPKARDYMLYGPRVKGVTQPDQENRLFWWETDTDLDWVRVAGHYHRVHISDHNLVLDGGMGGSWHRGSDSNSDNLLCLWDVEAKELITFS